MGRGWWAGVVCGGAVGALAGWTTLFVAAYVGGKKIQPEVAVLVERAEGARATEPTEGAAYTVEWEVSHHPLDPPFLAFLEFLAGADVVDEHIQDTLALLRWDDEGGFCG